MMTSLPHFPDSVFNVRSLPQVSLRPCRSVPGTDFVHEKSTAASVWTAGGKSGS